MLEACVRDQDSGSTPILCCRYTSQRQGVQKVIDDVIETLPYLWGRKGGGWFVFRVPEGPEHPPLPYS